MAKILDLEIARLEQQLAEQSSRGEQDAALETSQEIRALKRVRPIFEASERSLANYQKRIHDLAVLKKWSDKLAWLQLGAFKEVGELVQAMEHFEDARRGYLTATDEYNHRQTIAKEFGDAIFFIFQAMHHYDINLDDALEMVIARNEVEKKKTIDATGRIIRR